MLPNTLISTAIVILGAAVGPYAARSAEPTDENQKTIRVPAEHPTIQAAIDAAADGDRVVVSPGVYRESLKIAGKSIVLCSEFALTGDA